MPYFPLLAAQILTLAMASNGAKRQKKDEHASLEAWFPSTFRLELMRTAERLASGGKGILAVDEPPGTCAKRVPFVASTAKPGEDGFYETLPNTAENRAAYRHLLFSTPGLGSYIGGVILHEETLFQDTPEGESFVQLLAKQDIIPGIKVDRAFHEMLQPTHSQYLGGVKETVTQGLDDLGERCKKYYE